MTIKEDDLNRSLGRIESKVDSLISASNDYEARLRDLERSKWWSVGAAGAVTTIVNLAVFGLTGRH